MDYANFIKKLELPAGFAAPTRLTYEDIVARTLTRADLDDDVRGINASVDLIQTTRGGGWPTGPVTEEENFVDLVWHELEFREGASFAYAVYDDGGEYLGCCYLYPMGRRTQLSESLLQLRRRRQLVGDARRLRSWLLREAPCRAPAVARRELPVRRRLLLQPRAAVGLACVVDQYAPLGCDR